MQPFHCDLQPRLHEPHRTTQTGTTTRCKTHRRNHNDRSRTRRTHEVPLHRRLQPLYTEKHKVSCSGNAFCRITWLTRISLRTWQHQLTTIMQPFQCDLICNQRFSNYARRNNHSLQNTEEEPIRAWNDRSRTRRTHEVPFIAGCNHLTRKNTRFRAPASSPTQRPCNIHAATTMRFAASRRKPARIYAHGNTRWQQSCSHSNAICNQRFQNTL